MEPLDDTLTTATDGPAPEQRTICRHCRKAFVNRPKNMCWSCYYTPGVRDLYPSTSLYAYRSPIGQGCRNAPPPPWPTRAEPGTDEKLRVIEWRAKHGFALWHPRDPVIVPTASGNLLPGRLLIAVGLDDEPIAA